MDLQSELVRLFDSFEFCNPIDQIGRKNFEREYTWEVILEAHYRRLFGSPLVASSREVSLSGA